jgi:hypothetical protein
MPGRLNLHGFFCPYSCLYSDCIVHTRLAVTSIHESTQQPELMRCTTTRTLLRDIMVKTYGTLTFNAAMVDNLLYRRTTDAHTFGTLQEDHTHLLRCRQAHTPRCA